MRPLQGTPEGPVWIGVRSCPHVSGISGNGCVEAQAVYCWMWAVGLGSSYFGAGCSMCCEMLSWFGKSCFGSLHLVDVSWRRV